MKKSELKAIVIETLQEFGRSRAEANAIKAKLVVAKTQVEAALSLLSGESPNEIVHKEVKALKAHIEKIMKGL